MFFELESDKESHFFVQEFVVNGKNVFCYNASVSYTIYTTEGFVLGSTPTGEASKMYWLYTRDFGLIRAKAQSVRLINSKLRYSLDDFSYVFFSLVRGREVWRLTGAVDKVSPKENVQMRARVLSLVRRLVQGEERNEDLFNSLKLMVSGDVPSDVHVKNSNSFESLILVHVLSALGYIDAKKFITVPVGSSITSQDLDVCRTKKNEVISEINKAIKETQL